MSAKQTTQRLLPMQLETKAPEAASPGSHKAIIQSMGLLSKEQRHDMQSRSQKPQSIVQRPRILTEAP